MALGGCENGRGVAVYGLRISSKTALLVMEDGWVISSKPIPSLAHS